MDFKRVILVPHYTEEDLLDFLLPVLGIDAGHLKNIIVQSSPKVITKKMYVRLITGRLPGNEMIILGILISYSECSEDIGFLLKIIKDKGEVLIELVGR